MSVELIQGDCIEHMRALATGSVAAIIGDPPYELTNLAFDKQPFDWQAWWPEALRVCKPTAPIVLFSQQPFTSALIMSQPKMWRYELIWDKVSSVGFFDAANRPLRAHEHIQIFIRAFTGSVYNPQMRTGTLRRKGGGVCKGDFIYSTKTLTTSFNNQYFPTSVLTFSNADHTEVLHPTQKPLTLIRWLVRTYSNAADLILDPWAGSGTTLVACLEEGRNAIGYELDADYYAKAQRRIELAQMQQRIDWSAA